MRRFLLVGFLIALRWPALPQAPKREIVIPAGTRVVVALTSPVWAKSARLGDPVYGVAAFPVIVGNEVAIPPGTYLRAQVEIMTLSGPRNRSPEFRMECTQMVFAGGYVVSLADQAHATASVVVSRASDVVLDRGTQIEVVFERPLVLDAGRIAVAVRESKRPNLAEWKSASRCRPTPATPGTSDTVIPGTPAIPGTPDTVIPGGPGTPGTVIPGTPATPGTPPVIIHGTPGTPAIPCPTAPAAVSRPAVHTERFRLKVPARAGSQMLAAGTYEARWEGLGPAVEVRILEKGHLLVAVPARVIALGKESPGTELATRTDANLGAVLESVEFEGKTYGLQFGQQ